MTKRYIDNSTICHTCFCDVAVRISAHLSSFCLGRPEPEKTFMLAFRVHFVILAHTWCVLRRIGVDAKFGNALVPELGQRSAECKFLYIRQILPFLSIKYPTL